MRALLPLLAGLMLVLTGWASMAHAAEPNGGQVAGISFTAHVPGDGDEVPADSDSALPHHHGNCHAHDVGTPASSVAVAAGPRHFRARHGNVANMLAGMAGSVIPRPPRT